MHMIEAEEYFSLMFETGWIEIEVLEYYTLSFPLLISVLVSEKYPQVRSAFEKCSLSLQTLPNCGWFDS